MAHIPKFPPEFNDFKPLPPPYPPIPNFLVNPWLTSEQMTGLERETGRWAARRAEAFTSPADGFEMARRAARYMYEGFKAKLPVELPPVAAPLAAPRKARVPKERVPTMAKELAPLVGVLTSKQEGELTDAALEEIARIRQRYRRMPTIEEKIELSKAVVAWAETGGAKITVEKGGEIVNKALGRFAPVKP